MPQLMTTMSVSSVLPSLKRSAVDPAVRRGCAWSPFRAAPRTPIAFQLALQERAAGGIELLDHQVRRDLDDGDFEAVAEQAAGRFQAEQAAADDDGRDRTPGRRRAMAAQSSSVRKTKTPCCSRLPCGGTNGREPVARTRTS